MESEFADFTATITTLIPVLLLLLSTVTLIALCLRCRVKEETSARAARCRSSKSDSCLQMESNQNAFICLHKLQASTGKPGKPEAVSVSHDSIQLEWTKPEQDAHNIASYTIIYRSNADPSDQWMQQEATTEDATVAQLSENSTYSFKVRPELKNGQPGPESDESNPIHTTMIIPSKPGQPRTLNITHDSIGLEWSKPEQGAHNIASYTIFYRSSIDPSHQWMQQRTNTAIEEATVSQLSKNGVYLFKVRPELKNGQHGSESDESKPMQTAMIIPSKPGQPRTLSITHDSIELEWSKPEQGAHNVTLYSILYRSTSDPSDQWIVHETKVVEGKTEATISQLSENNTYLFKIRAELSGGESGPEGDKSEPVLTKMIMPSKPGQPRAIKVSDSSIDLEWSKPEQGAQNILSYTVCYRSISESDPPDKWSEMGTPCEKIILSNLAEQTTFVCYVKVCPKLTVSRTDGVDGESDISEPIRTLPRLSEKNIIDLAWEARVKWYHIGIQLRQKTTDLDVIGKEKHDGTCFTRVIIEWLRKGKATWKELIDALNHKTVGFSNLADKIADDCLIKDCSDDQLVSPVAKPFQFAGVGFTCPLCGECSMEEYYKGKCPKLDSPPDLAFPYLVKQFLTENEKINLHARLTQDTEDIRKEFNNLLEKVRESFNKQDIDLQRMIESIEDLLSFSSLQMEPSKTKSAGAIIRHLQQKKYISFFNCCVVQTLIAKYGTDDDKKMLSAYEAKFKKFCERSVFEVPPTVFGPPPDNGQMLAFKVTDEVPRYLHEFAADISVPPSYSTVETSSKTLKLSLNDTLNIQIMIAKILGIENFGSLIFLGAQEGCIELRFLIPNITLDRIKQQQNVDTLIELPGFTALESGGIHIL